MRDAVTFLRGMLQMVGDHPEVSEVRKSFIALSESDRQLELIQSGQLILALPSEPDKFATVANSKLETVSNFTA